MNNHGFHMSQTPTSGHPSPRPGSRGGAPVANMRQRQTKAASPQPRMPSVEKGSTPSVQLAQELAQDEPERSLPSPNITSENVEDAYVEFIFYCNPYIPFSTSTVELRRGFNSLPKTDGKTFSVFPLFELIKKLESKEIETWAQLVIDMGVKQPDVAIGQSTQKVQQYAVRLKRWLHAYHIDAFFQYCLGKSNTYFTETPRVAEISEATVRDGVPPEEDLAIRALLPEWRPKRGRRPNDDGSKVSPQAKRQMRASSLTADETISSAVPVTAYPQSAFPWDRQSNSTDPWAAAQRAIAPRAEEQQIHSHPPNEAVPAQSIESSIQMYMENEGLYPHSAVHTRPPTSAFPSSAAPQSAHPSSAVASPRPRKRHGPSVSAAWTPDGSSSKVRGRPPANRSTQDGPFSTFPAKAPSMPPSSGIAPPTPQSSQSQQTSLHSAQQPTPSTAQTDSPFSASLMRRPSKLQLQVPQHAGGPVRLATPPRVLLNGERGPPLERRTSVDFFASVGEEASELGEDEEGQIDWKRRALGLQRKVRELEAELKAVKRRVLEAVM